MRWAASPTSASLSATNPLLTYSKTRAEQPPPISIETKTSTTSFGAIFDPTISAMIHLYN